MLASRQGPLPAPAPARREDRATAASLSPGPPAAGSFPERLAPLPGRGPGRAATIATRWAWGRKGRGTRREGVGQRRRGGAARPATLAPPPRDAAADSKLPLSCARDGPLRASLAPRLRAPQQPADSLCPAPPAQRRPGSAPSSPRRVGGAASAGSRRRVNRVV